MNVFVSGSPAEKKRQPSESKEKESSQNSAPDSGGSGVKTFSLTRRIIISVVTCQLLLTLGLILVAVLYAREQLRGTFDAGLDGDARAALALVRYTEMKPTFLCSIRNSCHLCSIRSAIHRKVKVLLGSSRKLRRNSLPTLRPGDQMAVLAPNFIKILMGLIEHRWQEFRIEHKNVGLHLGISDQGQCGPGVPVQPGIEGSAELLSSVKYGHENQAKSKQQLAGHHRNDDAARQRKSFNARTARIGS